MSSSKRLVIPRGLVSLAERPAGDQAVGIAPSSIPQATGRTLRADEIEQIRQQGIARGRLLEREEASKVFAQSARILDQEVRTLSDARSQDQECLRDFAIRLSCFIAEELVGTQIAADAHDLRAMVTRVLDQVLPELTGEKIVLQVHPDDLNLISNDYLKEIGAASVRVVPNPSLDRAAMRVVGNGAEFYAGVSDRLEAMKSSLLKDLQEESDD